MTCLENAPPKERKWGKEMTTTTMTQGCRYITLFATIYEQGVVIITKVLLSANTAFAMVTLPHMEYTFVHAFFPEISRSRFPGIPTILPFPISREIGPGFPGIRFIK
jgi:hypothetical protein